MHSVAWSSQWQCLLWSTTTATLVQVVAVLLYNIVVQQHSCTTYTDVVKLEYIYILILNCLAYYYNTSIRMVLKCKVLKLVSKTFFVQLLNFLHTNHNDIFLILQSTAWGQEQNYVCECDQAVISVK